MALYLVQHGKSLPKDADPQKGLSDDGRAEVMRVADTAKGYNVPVGSICHSGKTRARQTAEIFASALAPRQGIQEKSGLNPLDDVIPIAASINTADDTMLVGHLPFMARMCSYLIMGKIDKPVLKFQNGGIVCMDIDEDAQSWVIKWTLMPVIG